MQRCNDGRSAGAHFRQLRRIPLLGCAARRVCVQLRQVRQGFHLVRSHSTVPVYHLVVQVSVLLLP